MSTTIKNYTISCKKFQNLYKNLNNTINPQNSFILLVQIKKHTKGQNIWEKS